MSGEPLDLSCYSVRTDLAVEARQQVLDQNEVENQSHLEGVIIHEREENGITITNIEITEKGTEVVGKKPGNYLTIEALGIRNQNTDLQHDVEKYLQKNLAHFLIREGLLKTQAACW